MEYGPRYTYRSIKTRTSTSFNDENKNEKEKQSAKYKIRKEIKSNGFKIRVQNVQRSPNWQIVC